MMANGRIRPLWPVLISVLLALFATGCSTSTENGGLSLVDEQGNHPANFLSTHPAFAVSSVAQCRPCHGDDLAGGIANTSCYTAACHHGTVPGWATPAVHGAEAKKAPGSSGFVSCQICHGNDFLGGAVQVACLSASCHGGPGTTPHPSQWGGGDTYRHSTTDEANASVCAQCHLNGNNSPIGSPSPPAPAGTSPGCFNSTLCHGASAVPHPVDNTWVAASGAAQPHGNSAKTTPGASTGFAYCQVCHGEGTDFAGGSSGTDCYSCHGGLGINPHPANWRTGDTYVHTNVDEGNAAVCAYCHAGGLISPIPAPPAPPPGTPPGCFNGTLCHAIPVPHPVDNTWVATSGADQPHGNAAKAAAGTSSGFLYCQACHGSGSGFNAFAGGLSGVSCYLCHNDLSLPVPHPPGNQWQTSGGYTHQNTDPSNAVVCAYCHRNANPGTAGCFNNTLCHN